MFVFMQYDSENSAETVDRKNAASFRGEGAEQAVEREAGVWGVKDAHGI